jgi:hypothetical protein
MRRFVALLILLWALGNVLVSYLFITNAFVAKTAAKEGLLAQLALLFGGVLIEIFALALIWQCLRAILSRDVAST